MRYVIAVSILATGASALAQEDEATELTFEQEGTVAVNQCFQTCAGQWLRGNMHAYELQNQLQSIIFANPLSTLGPLPDDLWNYLVADKAIQQCAVAVESALIAKVCTSGCGEVEMVYGEPPSETKTVYEELLDSILINDLVEAGLMARTEDAPGVSMDTGVEFNDACANWQNRHLTDAASFDPGRLLDRGANPAR